MIICFFLLISIIDFTYCEEIKSPINEYVLKPYNSEYNILISGHLYGSPDNPNSVFPSSSITANIDYLNSLDISFLVSLGDNYRKADNINMRNFINAFAMKIDYPIFIAVGNHDVSDRVRYNNIFGKTYYDFTYGSELFIFLDTEFDDTKKIDEQINFLINVINKIRLKDDIKNVFIFTHKLIWAQIIKDYEIVFLNVNSKRGYEKQYKFGKLIYDEINKISHEKNVFWISGDIGVSWSLPLFYDKDEESNVTFIANGLGDTENDLIINASIYKGEVSFKPLSLTGKNILDIKQYNTHYWNEYFKNKHNKNFKSLLYSKFSLFFNRYFIVLIIFNLLIISIIIFSKNYFKSDS